MELSNFGLTSSVISDRVCRFLSFTYRCIFRSPRTSVFLGRPLQCFFSQDPRALYRVRYLEIPDWFTERIPAISCWVNIVIIAFFTGVDICLPFKAILSIIKYMTHKHPFTTAGCLDRCISNANEMKNWF